MWDQLRIEFAQASRLYRPQVFHGDAVVITSEETRRIYGDAGLGWGAFVSGTVRTIEMDGTHHSIIAPPLVGELAQHVADATRAMDRG